MRDGSTSVGTGTSVSTPLPDGEDPLLGSTDGTLTEPLMGRLGAAGVNRYEGEGDARASLDAYVRETSLSQLCTL